MTRSLEQEWSMLDTRSSPLENHKLEGYEQVIDWLFVQLPNYQKEGSQAYKPGLDNIKKLLQDLDNPQELFASIHIAGTNGKGSVAHMLSAIYQANGYKVGVFTSPHIKDFRERIKINGEMVSEAFVVDFVKSYKSSIDSLSASFFEICTAMAFEAFKQEKVDIAIVETGLGGRLDSTNVLNPELSIITSIAKDHTNFLGDTLVEIAGEKAGIIKPNTPVVLNRMADELDEVFVNKAKKENAPLSYPKDIFLEVKLLGKFQLSNALLAWQATQVLLDKFPLKEEKSRYGLMNVAELTNFMGRLQVIQNDPIVLVDAAHNAAGVKNLMLELSYLNPARLHLVFGASNDKDLDEVFELFKPSADYYFTEFNSSRSSKKEDFKRLADKKGLNFSLYHSPKKALDVALSAASDNELIVVFGSFFLLEEII